MILISSKISDGNMSLVRGEPQKALENRERFLKSLGINTHEVAEVIQVHGNRVVLVKEIIDPNTEADGMITNKSGIYLMVKTADCIPIGLYDPKHNAIGLIHTGWKGLESGIIKNILKQMQKYFKSNPKDLIIKFGPSIGPCHYRIDLWTEAENQLINIGTLKESIDNPRICTYESKEYFSHRRAEDNNIPDYRFITILGLKNVS